jgi:flagellar basal body-associated protein FliL
MRKVLRENGLTLVLLVLFALTMVGQTLAGLRKYNEDQKEHHQPTVTLLHYVATGHFWEATAENWESEFLQMMMFVVLTVFLRQKGSPESKAMEGEEEVDADPAASRHDRKAPWPVRKGGVALFLYSHSLSITFGLLFLMSFAIHAWGGSKEYSADQQAQGQPPATLAQYVGSSTFWFQSFQNWQSEFLSLAAMVYLAVYLREKGSAESKPVATPHDEQGPS